MTFLLKVLSLLKNVKWAAVEKVVLRITVAVKQWEAKRQAKKAAKSKQPKE